MRWSRAAATAAGSPPPATDPSRKIRSGSIPGRDRDTWGLGWYLANISDSIEFPVELDTEQGVELFYNIAVTPWLHITPDLQVIVDPGGGVGDRDVAIVAGIRAQMSL